MRASFFARHREHAKGIIVAQIGLHREGKLLKVLERLEIGGMHALGIEGFAIVRHMLVGMSEAPGHAVPLQRHDLIARGPFGGVEHRVSHGFNRLKTAARFSRKAATPSA